MQNTRCPTCGREAAPDTACGSAVNGTDGRVPVPPPEVAGWHIEHASPDVLAWAAQTLDMEAYRAAVREIEQGGGHRFEDFIDEIERIVNGQQ